MQASGVDSILTLTCALQMVEKLRGECLAAGYPASVATVYMWLVQASARPNAPQEFDGEGLRDDNAIEC